MIFRYFRLSPGAHRLSASLRDMRQVVAATALRLKDADAPRVPAAACASVAG